MILLVEPEAVLRAQLAASVGETDALVQFRSLEEASGALVGPGQIQLLVLGPGIERDAGLRFAEKVGERQDRVGTLLVTPTLDPVLLREALRSGIDDVLTLDAPEAEWREAIARAQARLASDRGGAPSPQGDEERSGRLITVFSSKGGSGKSLVASNLAILVAERTGQPVTLVDLDLQSGDLAIMLQLMPALSIYDAAQASTHLDAEALAGHLTAHHSGVSLLAAPMEPSLAEQVSGEAVARILQLLKGSTPVTIVDGPASFTDQLLASVDLSDLIVLVGSMDVPSIKNLRLAMNTLAQLGFPRDHIKLVLNRADSKVGLRSADVEKSLGAKIDVMIPSSRDVPLSVNQGSPLAVSRPKSAVVSAIRELLPHVAPQATADGGRRRRRT
jgi:pilus assembly protein CpaE